MLVYTKEARDDGDDDINYINNNDKYNNNIY